MFTCLFTYWSDPILYSMDRMNVVVIASSVFVITFRSVCYKTHWCISFQFDVLTAVIDPKLGQGLLVQ